MTTTKTKWQLCEVKDVSTNLIAAVIPQYTYVSIHHKVHLKKVCLRFAKEWILNVLSLSHTHTNRNMSSDKKQRRCFLSSWDGLRGWSGEVADMIDCLYDHLLHSRFAGCFPLELLSR